MATDFKPSAIKQIICPTKIVSDGADTGEWRPILDFSPLNKYVRPKQFRMVQIADAIQLNLLAYYRPCVHHFQQPVPILNMICPDLDWLSQGTNILAGLIFPGPWMTFCHSGDRCLRHRLVGKHWNGVCSWVLVPGGQPILHQCPRTARSILSTETFCQISDRRSGPHKIGQLNCCLLILSRRFEYQGGRSVSGGRSFRPKELCTWQWFSQSSKYGIVLTAVCLHQYWYISYLCIVHATRIGRDGCRRFLHQLQKYVGIGVSLDLAFTKGTDKDPGGGLQSHPHCTNLGFRKQFAFCAIRW